MDFSSYRTAEMLRKRAIQSIRQSTIHADECFEKVGFPVRVSCHDDLALYLDIMHEGRFEPLMTELDGLTEDELEEFLEAAVDYCKFFATQFRGHQLPVPVAGLFAQYCISLKLRGIPERTEVLEIGPGSGLISFFISKDQVCKRYDQIEAIEAFYLLQSLIGRHVYGHRFVDHAQIDHRAVGLGDLALAKAEKVRSVYDWDIATLRVDVDRTPRSEHFPWWRAGDVFERKYDVVTANANLTEFSVQAQIYYASLAAQVLKPGGVFLAQCVGSRDSTTAETIKRFVAAGFVPLAVARNYPPYADGTATSRPSRKFAMVNVVLLPVRHPSAREAAFAQPGSPDLNLNSGLTRSIFGIDRPAGRTVKPADIVGLVEERLRRSW